jgi:hypothetical protein
MFTYEISFDGLPKGIAEACESEILDSYLMMT